MFVALSLGAAALAQERVELIDGTPDFVDCLDDTMCGDDFRRFLSQTMLEQGFTFAHDPQATSVIVSRGHGWVIGMQVTTFPMIRERENPWGKVENTYRTPVLPKLVIGRKWKVGQIGRLAVGGHVLPPIPVDDAMAWTAGLDASAGLALGIARLGIEGTYAYGSATASVISTQEQYDMREGYAESGYLDDYEGRCSDGCQDHFSTHTAGVKIGAAVGLGLGLAPYLKVGVDWFDYRLQVGYDETTWAMGGTHAVADIGLNFQPLKNLQFAVGTTMAYRPAEVSISDGGILFGLNGAASVVF
jgi:hypothetical protein